MTDEPELSHEELSYLVHFGVKGMKWGRRRSDAELATAAKKKEIDKNYKENFNKVLDKRFSDNTYTQDRYDKLSTNKEFVKKGTELKRIVGDRNKDALDRYVSTNQQDHENYKTGLGNRLVGERYQITLKAMTNLSSPSQKERVDAFVSLMDTPSIQLKNGKTVSGREMLKKQGYGKDAKRLDSQQLGLKHYSSFLDNQWRESSINDAYYKEVARRGYNSLVDDNDAGILSTQPLIILDPKGSVKRMSIEPLSKQDVRDARATFKVPD